MDEDAEIKDMIIEKLKDMGLYPQEGEEFNSLTIEELNNLIEKLKKIFF